MTLALAINMTDFDPYHKWLGILPKDQPPHHYRLLGIELFEADPDVIDSAADKQMTYLRSCASGPHVALSQKLLNEVAAARVCLLNAEKKRAYDTELTKKLAQHGPLASLLPDSRRVRVIGIGAALAIALGAVVLVIATREDQPPPASKRPKSSAQVVARNENDAQSNKAAPPDKSAINKKAIDEDKTPREKEVARNDESRAAPSSQNKSEKSSELPAKDSESAASVDLRPNRPARISVIVNITPPDAQVTVTGEGISIEGAGETRIIWFQKETNLAALIASADGYKTTARNVDPRLWSDAPLRIELERASAASAPGTESTAAAEKTDSGKSEAEKNSGSLERAAAAYRRELSDAKRDLLKQFDKLNAPLMQQASRTPAALKGVDLLAEERKVFESNGLIPWSAPMRPFAAAYLQAIDKAAKTLRKTYLPAIQAQTRRKNTSEAARLRSELDSIVSPPLVAKWRHQANNDPYKMVWFFANGAIGRPEGDSRWSCDERGALEIRWRNPNAPNGVYVDKCKVSGDGKTYTGRGNTGASISGILANDG